MQSLKRTLKPVQLASSFVCLLIAWTSVISAGESIPIEAPKQPSIAKSLWQRTTLTDNWFGSGSTMREYGVNFGGSLTQFYQGLAVGNGSHNWKYGGKFDGFVRIDGSKLGLWQGFGINAHAEVNYGKSPAFAGGTFLPNNLALTFPGSNGDFADLTLYFTQQLPDDVTLMFGKINTVDLYDASREFSAGRSIEQYETSPAVPTEDNPQPSTKMLALSPLAFPTIITP